MSDFEWVFALKDQASGALGSVVRQAKAADTALGGAGVASVKLDAGLDKLTTTQLDLAIASLKLEDAEQRLQESLKDAGGDTKSLTAEQLAMVREIRVAKGEVADLGDNLRKTTSELKATELQGTKMAKAASGISAAGVALGSVMSDLAMGALKAVGSAMLGLSTGFAAAVSDAVQFKATTVGLFTGITGSAAGGSVALGSILEIAKATRQPLEEARSTYAALIATGMDQSMAVNVAKLGADLKVTGDKGAEAFNQLIDAMGKGKAEAGQFEALSKVFGRDTLGKALGLSSEALERTAAGATLLDQALAGMDPRKLIDVSLALQSAKGALGSTASAAATFGQRWESLKGITALNFAEEAGLTGDALGGLLDRVAEISRSDGFKRFAEDTGAALKWLADATLDTTDWIIENWDSVKVGLESLGILLGVVVATFALGGAIMIAPFVILSGVVLGVATGLGYLTGVAWDTWAAVADAGDKAITWVTDKFNALPANMRDIGLAVVQGFAGGITDSVGVATSAVSGVAGAVIGQFRSVLGIASPAKVPRKDGTWTTKGFALGIVDGLPDVLRAANDVASATAGALSGVEGTAPVAGMPSAGGGSAPQSSGGGTRGGGSISITFAAGSIVINGGDAGTMDLFRAKLVEAVETVAMSMGIDPASVEVAA